MEAEKKVAASVQVLKPNYMLMSLQRILVLAVILAGVVVVVYYTPMPGNYKYLYFFIVDRLTLNHKYHNCN